MEDEPLVALAEQTKLERYGYRVIIANSGEKAVATVETPEAIELILMDIDLGSGMDGTETAERILSSHDIPIVFLSSHTEPEIVEKTERITSYGYVLKNTATAVLDASIKMAFRLFESRKRLARGEERFQSLFENMSDAFALHEVIFDEVGIALDYRFVEVNSQFARRVGMAPKDLIGHTALELFPRTEQVWIEAFGRVTRSGNSEVVSSYSVELDRHYESRLYRTREGYCAGLFSDITDRERTENELRESERRYRKAQSVARVGSWEYRIDTGAFWFSDQTRQILGLEEEIDAHSLEAMIERVVDRDRDRARRAVTDLIENNAPCTIEFDIQPCGCNSPRTVRCVAELERDEHGAPGTITGVLQDVTEQKQLRDQLVATKEFYASIINNLADLVTIVGLDGRFSFIGYEDGTLGYEAESLMGRNTMDFVHPEDLPHVQREFQRLCEDGVPRIIEHRYRLADGTYRWFESNGRVAENGDGKPHQIIFNTRDITDRRLSEQRIRELVNDKEMLLKEVQHRVKNTLHTMGSLLSLQAATLQDEQAISAMKDMKARFNSMEVLYDQLYRTESHSNGSIRKYLVRLVESIVALFPHGSGVQIGTEICDLSLDAKHLSTVGMIVNELVTNSMKHAFVERAGGRLSVAVNIVGENVRISVQDDGPGLPSDFDPTSSQSFGITMIRALVDQLNGTLRFENGPETLAIVELPRPAEDAERL